MLCLELVLTKPYGNNKSRDENASIDDEHKGSMKRGHAVASSKLDQNEGTGGDMPTSGKYQCELKQAWPRPGAHKIVEELYGDLHWEGECEMGGCEDGVWKEGQDEAESSLLKEEDCKRDECGEKGDICGGFADMEGDVTGDQ